MTDKPQLFHRMGPNGSEYATAAEIAAEQAVRTDHSESITRLREVAAEHGKAGLFGLCCEASAALLEVHDNASVSLDNWVGPRELVNRVLGELTLPPFTRNGA